MYRGLPKRLEVAVHQKCLECPVKFNTTLAVPEQIETDMSARIRFPDDWSPAWVHKHFVPQTFPSISKSFPIHDGDFSFVTVRCVCARACVLPCDTYTFKCLVENKHVAGSKNFLLCVMCHWDGSATDSRGKSDRGSKSGQNCSLFSGMSFKGREMLVRDLLRRGHDCARDPAAS